MSAFIRALALLAILACAAAAADAAALVPKPRPLLRDFLGLCTHTVQFHPALYAPICRLARDYHGIDWDTGADPATPTMLPMARNRVDWLSLYRGWTAGGFTVDASLMFDQMPPAAWKDPAAAARAYGEAFARALGPSAGGPVASAEIGNEPGKYSDELYRTLFAAMAAGLRAGDTKLQVATCAADAGKSGDYCKSLSCVQGLDPLYDVITLHTYAMSEGWPTWRPARPEDPKIDYLARVREVIAWRDAHAPGKQVWITEFGYDACTKPPPPTGDFAKWVSASDEQQAQWLVRSILLFSAFDLDRAYIFWFDDQDQPQIHGAKGLTRKGVPKPAYWAVAHLTRVLGGYRFARIVLDRPGEACVYEFVDGADPKQHVWVAWSPTATDRTAALTVPAPKGSIVHGERMPLAKDELPGIACRVDAGALTLPLTESPLFLRWRD